MPCMCGATDCPSCGPAQGYSVVRVYDPRARRYRTMNPQDAIEAGLLAAEWDGEEDEPPEEE